MPIQQEVWATDIAENLFKDNEMLNRCVNDNDKLIGKVVHLPQAGAKPGVEKNRSTFPAVAAQRVDPDITYQIDEYTSDPTHVTLTEEIEASYQKRISILSNHINEIEEQVYDNILHDWSPSGATHPVQIVRTTGADRSAYKAGQTGTRKAVTKDDILELRRLFNRQNLPKRGRILVVDADMEIDLLKVPEFVDANKYGRSNIPMGALGMLFGFELYSRSDIVMFDNAANPAKKAVGSAIAATDNAACLAWHVDFLRKAVGTTTNGGIQVFENVRDAQYYGDVMSAMVRGGGRASREDYVGVFALVEAA